MAPLSKREDEIYRICIMKIFITIGTYQPFDRLIKVVDDLVVNHPNWNCVAQIGEGNYRPKNMKYERTLSESEFDRFFEEADVVISHAGMGTIISCLQNNKPIITLPRIAKYGEHVNDHQLANAKIFSEKGYLYPIFNEVDLSNYLDKIEDVKVLKHIEKYANKKLIDFLANLCN